MSRVYYADDLVQFPDYGNLLSRIQKAYHKFLAAVNLNTSPQNYEKQLISIRLNSDVCVFRRILVIKFRSNVTVHFGKFLGARTFRRFRAGISFESRKS